ncbi:MAG: transposase [Flavobacteriales bacterium]|nr:transposase [Flavobacteriales bacterium]
MHSPQRRATGATDTRPSVETSVGEVDIATPRDRAGTFEPQLVGSDSAC